MSKETEEKGEALYYNSPTVASTTFEDESSDLKFCVRAPSKEVGYFALRVLRVIKDELPVTDIDKFMEEAEETEVADLNQANQFKKVFTFSEVMQMLNNM